jgi:threonine dehydrogenase-like Zn-dependent dehydrogenase
VAVNVQAIVAAVGGTAGPVEVIGVGRKADELRETLGRRDGNDRPHVIVETTGDPDAIVDATRRVADDGTVLLAGPGGGEVAINLYADLHARGLTLIGIVDEPRGAPR